MTAEPARISRRSWLDNIRARPRLRTLIGSVIPVGWVTALLLIPYVLLLVQSFWKLENGTITHQLTLDNYRRLFGTALYPDTIAFSAGIALGQEGEGAEEVLARADVAMYREKRERSNRLR